MNAPTYNLRQADPDAGAYLRTVGQLADWCLAVGGSLRPIVDGYAEFVELNGRESRRSNPEYLLEALMLGVMWRARGPEVKAPNERRRGLVTELLRERRSGSAKRRDGSTAELVTVDGSAKRGCIDPTLQEIGQLLDWMLGSGEYDDECERLQGWKAFLSTTQPATNRSILRLIIAFAVRFEAAAERSLGAYTAGVDGFLRDELTIRPNREDTVHCSRRRVEYHLNMVGAEILNRAWRRGFLACRRHVVVLPGCARMRSESECRATEGASQQRRCTHCTLGCAVSAATRQAERSGSESVVVIHGSELSRYLDGRLFAGSDVGVVGIACAPGLIGAGWRARAKGFMAQCVLLNASGCLHWQAVAEPTCFDSAELARILDRSAAEDCITLTPRVA